MHISAVTAANARGQEAQALIQTILTAPRDRGHRDMETVFQAEPSRRRWWSRWPGRRRPAGDAVAGWRIGCYNRSVPASLQSGYRVRREFSHPVYLLHDGRLVVGAYRVVDAEGAVAELDLPRPRRPWFTPLADSREFFAARPEHYLKELTALRADIV
jgi:hypothetical protein